MARLQSPLRALPPLQQPIYFTSQLLQELQSIVNQRDGPPAASLTVPEVPMMMPFMHVQPATSAASPSPANVRAWNLEKQMVALRENVSLFQLPFFYYQDFCADSRDGVRPGGTGSGGSGAKTQETLLAFARFNRVLPLKQGQMVLLDIWEYVMDMCDEVPVRNRCRSLFLHIASCICRRVEFIDQFTIHQQCVVVDKEVENRYMNLLQRNVLYASTKLQKFSLLGEDLELFVSHVFAMVCFRFPSLSCWLLMQSVLDCTELLEDHLPSPGSSGSLSIAGQPSSGATSKAEHDVSMRPQVALQHCQALFGPNGMLSHSSKTSKSTRTCFLRSPRDSFRCWHSVDDEDVSEDDEEEPTNDQGDNNDTTDAGEHISLDKQRVWQRFIRYKLTRRDQVAEMLDVDEHQLDSLRNPVAQCVWQNADATLETAFQMGIFRAEQNYTEESVVMAQPFWRTSPQREHAYLRSDESWRDQLETAVHRFATRLCSPTKSNLISCRFIPALLSDVACWYHGWSPRNFAWHGIPGYFALVRLYFALFKRMCQRRHSSAEMPPGLCVWSSSLAKTSSGACQQVRVRESRASSNQREDDPWVAYWDSREVEKMIAGLREVFKNELLAGAFVQVVLEGTNLNDLKSVNYSFTILQHVLEAAAESSTRYANNITGVAVGASSTSSSPWKSKSPVLPNSFDWTFYLRTIQNALRSVHAQVLLKVLTFLYNTIDLMDSNARRRLFCEVLLRDNFFCFFLHWNEEIRKLFGYILVFKSFATSRLELPCRADRVLLAPRLAAHELSKNYWAQLSHMTRSWFRGEPQQDEDGVSSASNNEPDYSISRRLVAWGDANDSTSDEWTSNQCQHPMMTTISTSAESSVFRKCLSDESLSVDLSICSKLDALFKMVADQKHGHAHYFSKQQEVYVDKALDKYCGILWEYYEAALAKPSSIPVAPILEFTISIPNLVE